MNPNGNISTEWPKVLSFVWENYYFIQKLSFLINTLFGKVFQTSGVTGLNNATACETLLLKTYFNCWKKYFLVWHFTENQVFAISALFSYFSVCSLLKLIRLVCY